MIRLKTAIWAVAFFAFAAFPLCAAQAAGGVTAEVYLVNDSGNGVKVGTVKFGDDKNGLVVKANLKGLPPGVHGFHVHEKPDCAPSAKDGKVTPAGSAGGHYDPAVSGKHLGPEKGGHLGDLPALTVAENGTAKVTLHIKGIKAEEFKNHALMIHAGSDNYSDLPAPLGGGGGRIACGIIK
jgi:Cu-Zn family superoxide dismutase